MYRIDKWVITRWETVAWTDSAVWANMVCAALDESPEKVDTRYVWVGLPRPEHKESVYESQD